MARNERKGGLLGIRFEVYVNYIFRKQGATLERRRLNEAPEAYTKDYTIPIGLKVVEFKGLNELSIHEEEAKLYIPGKNFPCVDFILSPNTWLQITTTEDHGIPHEPAKKLLQKMPKGKIQLYFLVPDDIYKTFPLQTYRATGGNKIQHVSPELEERVEQWALRMPMSLED